jgi:hypothetical protein
MAIDLSPAPAFSSDDVRGLCVCNIVGIKLHLAWGREITVQSSRYLPRSHRFECH